MGRGVITLRILGSLRVRHEDGSVRLHLCLDCQVFVRYLNGSLLDWKANLGSGLRRYIRWMLDAAVRVF